MTITTHPGCPAAVYSHSSQTTSSFSMTPATATGRPLARTLQHESIQRVADDVTATAAHGGVARTPALEVIRR